ncbi:hypothetical protein DAPPUDRAFT_319223 [Daphnia pulex]|uniref:Uncharacterized protein n=1 Tax=Daphnia pulex TaxID=6669 RepID=E9GL24_DAPPU|nr:hypothetical protein DAPPUDRAFT_319223 [Daphnia pulex]|eukprot:EFX79779.1 hypothetical protein DAPPUDRAFT_319223 [Daphnia pulex]
MVDRGVYTLRGWLAFVSFLDFAQALRSWFDKDVFLGSYYKNFNTSTNITDLENLPLPSSSARLLIAYSIQNGSILLLSAFCIHHWSMAVMAMFSLLLKIVYLMLEALKFKSTPFNFHIIFPVIVDGITFIALTFSPKLLKKEVLNDQENEEILKLCNGKPIYLPPKKKKHN